MNTRPLRSALYVVLTALFLLAGSAARAQSVTYTFEQFAAGTTTPIINAAPDTGTAAFHASFTAAPNSTSFIISPFVANSLFSGNSLSEPAGASGNTLTVTLNMMVTTVSFVFATNGAGTITFACSSGTMMVASTTQSGGFPGGTLTFTSATPFSSFTITDGASPEFAIDNLTMRIAAGVPESGSTILLLAGAAAAIVVVRRFRPEVV